MEFSHRAKIKRRTAEAIINASAVFFSANGRSCPTCGVSFLCRYSRLMCTKKQSLDRAFSKARGVSGQRPDSSSAAHKACIIPFFDIARKRFPLAGKSKIQTKKSPLWGFFCLPAGPCYPTEETLPSQGGILFAPLCYQRPLILRSFSAETTGSGRGGRSAFPKAKLLYFGLRFKNVGLYDRTITHSAGRKYKK